MVAVQFLLSLLADDGKLGKWIWDQARADAAPFPTRPHLLRLSSWIAQPKSSETENARMNGCMNRIPLSEIRRR